MGQFSRDIVEASNMPFRRGAPQQVVTFVGLKPVTSSGLDPIALWVIQTFLIIVFTEILSPLFARIRLPRVIAEVISGVILGPTILGHIPNFTNNFFPPHSIYVLAHISTFGLFFFLFIVCLNADPSVARRNIMPSLAIFSASLIPLLIGAAMATYLYHNFAEPSVNFGHFILLVTVAVSITALPVLCRILTEVSLLGTDVGVVVLTAGIGNDAIGWVLLALTVVLVNASPRLTILVPFIYISCYTLVLLLVKPIFRWLAQKTGSLESKEPTPLMMRMTLTLVLFVAFFTYIIDVHPIFGAFITGFIIPKDNGFAISVAKKMEGPFTLFFLPQYFALSGLMLDLSHLKNGIDAGYTILICVVALVAEFLPCFVAAWIRGPFTIRESCAVGMLMSCRSPVEIIVLNVGLQAKILDQRIFTMLVLHALVLTIITIPLTILIYPSPDRFTRSKFVFVLDNIEQLPSAMTLAQLLQRPFASNRSCVSETISINTIRRVELTERTSAASTSQVADTLIHNDPILSVFRMFRHLNPFSMSVSLPGISDDEFSTCVADHARKSGSQMVVVFWPLAHPAPESSTSSHTVPSNSSEPHSSGSSGADNAASLRSQFIGRVFADSPSDVALFIDRRLWTDPCSTTPHVFLPFFGGPDDRLALSLVIRLCMHEGSSATVMRLGRLGSDGNELVVDSTGGPGWVPQRDDGTPNDIQLNILGQDDDLRDRVRSSTSSSNVEVHDALNRISFFQAESTDRPLDRMLELAKGEASRTSKPLLVVAGRSRPMAIESPRREPTQLISERNTSLPSDVAETFGDVASAFVLAGGGESLIVTQAQS
ncbi:cation/H+ exchanger [Lactifluus subvellereus]|nr:cation/H+ exchanger [Lactifluus subvellereus]